MFKIDCYLIVQAPFINLSIIWEDTGRSITFLRKLWLFLCKGAMSVCLSSLGNFEERIESLMSSHVCFTKKSTFFFSRLVLISFFCFRSGHTFLEAILMKFFGKFSLSETFFTWPSKTITWQITRYSRHKVSTISGSVTQCETQINIRFLFYWSYCLLHMDHTALSIKF